MTNPENPAPQPPDRRLGSSWRSWDGNVETHEAALDEGPRLYFALMLGLLLAVTGILVVDAWLLLRFAFPSHPVATLAVDLGIGTPLVVWWTAYGACLFAMAARSPYLAFPWFSRWLTLQVPFLAFCCRPLGISRDRIGSSCIAITNTLARLQVRSVPVLRPLLLLPRCLAQETVRTVKAAAAEWGCPVVVVGANKMAREKVREMRPTVLLAVACERDLVSGLYDFGHKLPVLVLANRRPFGPCLRATIDFDLLRQALEDIYGLAQDGPPEPPPAQPTGRKDHPGE